MSKQDTGQPDPVEHLLASAFEQALSGPGNPELVDRVMAKIARQQRQRTLVLALFGLAALIVCTLSAAPLLELLPSLATGTFDNAMFKEPFSLPAGVVAVAIAIAGGWLLIEEVTI